MFNFDELTDLDLYQCGAWKCGGRQYEGAFRPSAQTQLRASRTISFEASLLAMDARIAGLMELAAPLNAVVDTALNTMDDLSGMPRKGTYRECVAYSAHVSDLAEHPSYWAEFPA